MKNRIGGLRNSLRGRRSKPDNNTENQYGTITEPKGRFPTCPEDASLAGTTVAHSYRSSVEEPHGSNSAAPPRCPGTCSSAFIRAPEQQPASRVFSALRIRRDSNRQDSGLTTSTDISVSSVVLRKLAGEPIDRVKRAVKVLKRYTFPKDLESRPAFDIAPDPFQVPQSQPRNDGTNDRFNAAYAVPGDFLNNELFSHRQQCETESPSHTSDMCWCKVAEQVIPSHNVWPSLQLPFLMSNPELAFKDMFGNTAFHYLAAQDGIQDPFVHLVCQALKVAWLPLRHLNTACQTFLHVLHPSWFQEGSKLGELLGVLRTADFDLLATDVYGRNFYHVFRSKMRGSVRLSSQSTDMYHLNRRDAFGTKPTEARSQFFATSSVPGIDTQVGMASREEATTQTALLRTITNAVGVDRYPYPNPYNYYPNPRDEDSQGRNGFHCLAEVNLDIQEGTQKRAPRPHSLVIPRSGPASHALKVEPGASPRPSLKRTLSVSEKADTSKSRPESRRFQTLKGLILAGVDANQYDKRGNTPLMAFVVNSKDGTERGQEEIRLIVKALVQDAGANMESRNRNGETALHLAARYGKMSAMHALVELGANPHVRNAQGLGILQVLDRLYLTTERDDKNNGRYEACRAIATRDDKYAVQCPIIMDEWAMRSSA